MVYIYIPTYIWLINVGEYTIHGSYGMEHVQPAIFHLHPVQPVELVGKPLDALNPILIP